MNRVSIMSLQAIQCGACLDCVFDPYSLNELERGSLKQDVNDMSYFLSQR